MSNILFYFLNKTNSLFGDITERPYITNARNQSAGILSIILLNEK